MNIIDLCNIELDCSNYNEILDLASKNYGINNGCLMNPHWVEESQNIYKNIFLNKKFSSLAWLGDGFPKTTEYRQTYKDKFNILNEFANLDTLDIQSGIYQFYALEDLFHDIFETKKKINIIEIGGGYGRLAMFFLKHFGENCHYISVDFIPPSLLFAPQVMKQMFPRLKVLDTSSIEKSDGINLEDYNFVSLPAWEVDKINSNNYDIGINIHSFQEMLKESIVFYKDCLWDKLKDNGILYTINNPADENGTYFEHARYDLESKFENIISKKYPMGSEYWDKMLNIPCMERIFIKKQNI